jgi:hypothetical protein
MCVCRKSDQFKKKKRGRFKYEFIRKFKKKRLTTTKKKINSISITIIINKNFF